LLLFNHLDLFSSLQFPGKSCKSLYFIYLIAERLLNNTFTSTIVSE